MNIHARAMHSSAHLYRVPSSTKFSQPPHNQQHGSSGGAGNVASLMPSPCTPAWPWPCDLGLRWLPLPRLPWALPFAWECDDPCGVASARSTCAKRSRCDDPRDTDAKMSRLTMWVRLWPKMGTRIDTQMIMERALRGSLDQMRVSTATVLMMATGTVCMTAVAVARRRKSCSSSTRPNASYTRAATPNPAEQHSRKKRVTYQV
mmetsp:Transcript_1064/g.2038  ORF Transcript_1064/g.2038 Transcript_1064/m.2038 type:complete len:204 (-) Transcript_1064:313-924(-)